MKTLSTRCGRLSLLAITIGLGACVDAKGSYDEFGERLPDAAPIEERCGEDLVPVEQLPDVSGEWLFTVHPSSVPENIVLLFRVNLDLRTLTANTGLIDVEATSLAVADQREVGEPFVAKDRSVCADASFEAPFVGTLVMPANPISFSDVAVDATMLGELKSADLLCGEMTGQAGVLTLTGTKWAAVRIPASGELPTPVFNCPAE